MIRQPAVAGMFYPGQEQALHAELHACMGDAPASGRSPAYGVIVPHAGYRYSGRIAGETLAKVRVPSRVILLGPNHHGLGAPAALFAEGRWRTPLGDVAVDAALASHLLESCPGLASDPQAHLHEHSLEVLLPFLQCVNPAAQIVPICFGRMKGQELITLGKTLQLALKALGEDVLIVASTDMSHYIAAALAARRDHLAIERMLALDPEGLLATVAAHDISMCGVYAVTVLLAAARQRGGVAATLIRYGHSGEVTGDLDQVVGYAGLVLR